MSPFRAIALKLALMLAASAVSLALAELALRVIYPRSEMFYSLIPGQYRVFNPNPRLIPGVEGPATYRVGAHGIRARPFGHADREHRILAIGGSTTECAYLDQLEAWSSLLERRLEKTADGRSVWVGNIGRSGLNSRDHVVQFRYHTRQYPDIDAVVLLLGGNDLTVALAQGDDYAIPPAITTPEATLRHSRRAFLIAPGALHAPASFYLLSPDAPWFKSTALWQLLKRTRIAFESRLAAAGLAQDETGQKYESWRANRQSASRIREEPPDLTLPLREFRRNLEEIAWLAESSGIRTILLTQPYLWRSDNTPEEEGLFWLGGISEDFQQTVGREYYSAAVLGETMMAYNETILDVCSKRASLECIDLARKVPKKSEFFYDDLHFTEAGSRLVAQVVTEYLLDRAPFSDR